MGAGVVGSTLETKIEWQFTIVGGPPVLTHAQIVDSLLHGGVEYWHGR